MTATEKIESKPKKYPTAQYSIDGDTITVEATDSNGFAVWLTEKKPGYTVGYDGWHDEFDDEDEALAAFAFGLSEDCRLKVIQRGDSDCACSPSSRMVALCRANAGRTRRCWQRGSSRRFLESVLNFHRPGAAKVFCRSPRQASTLGKENNPNRNRDRYRNRRKMALGHEKLDVYRLAIRYVAWVFERSEQLNGVHRHTRDQWLRASQSIPLNIAEGNGKSAEADSRRYFEIARGSALEWAAIQDVLVVGKSLEENESRERKLELDRMAAMLSRLGKRGYTVEEEPSSYGIDPNFDSDFDPDKINSQHCELT